MQLTRASQRNRSHVFAVLFVEYTCDVQYAHIGPSPASAPIWTRGPCTCASSCCAIRCCAIVEKMINVPHFPQHIKRCTRCGVEAHALLLLLNPIPFVFTARTTVRHSDAVSISSMPRRAPRPTRSVMRKCVSVCAHTGRVFSRKLRESHSRRCVSC